MLNFITTHLNVAFEIASEVLIGCRSICGHFRQCSEVFGKIVRNVSDIPIMTRGKPHAFDSEKVGRYMSQSVKV